LLKKGEKTKRAFSLHVKLARSFHVFWSYKMKKEKKVTSLQFVFQEDSRLRLSPFSLVCLFRHLNLFIKIRIKEQIGLF
jgi:hypothetical protein